MFSKNVFVYISILLNGLKYYKRNIRYQITNNMKQNKYIAILFSQTKTADLYPLSRGIPMSNLPVGNKRMIIYQLQQLEMIDNILKIVILYEPSNSLIVQDLQNNFISKYKDYRYIQNINFFQVRDKQSEYLSLQQYLNSNQYSSLISATNHSQNNTIQTGNYLNKSLNILVVPVNVICPNRYYANTVQQFENTNSDLTLLLKQKKQYAKGQKQPEIDIEPDYQIGMIGSGTVKQNQVISLKTIADYQYRGFQVHQSLYKQILTAQIHKVVDSGFYVLGPKLAQIARLFVTDEIANIKSDFIETIITNQTNINLLKIIYQNKALKVTAKMHDQNQFIRKISNLQLYQQLNYDSIIRGAKQKKALVPTKYTDKIDEQLMKNHRVSLIGADTTIDQKSRFIRACIGNNCMIGKNVEIQNSIILNNCTIADGYIFQQLQNQDQVMYYWPQMLNRLECQLIPVQTFPKMCNKEKQQT